MPATTYIQGQRKKARTVACAWHSAQGNGHTDVTATHNVYIPERGLIWPACGAHADAARPDWKVTLR